MQSGEIRYKTQALSSLDDLEAIIEAERFFRSDHPNRPRTALGRDW